MLLLSASSVGAQTTTATTTPGTPNTGAGGNGANMLLLGTSALVALAGAGYLARRYTTDSLE